MNPDTFATKPFDSSEILPWDHLAAPDKKYLLKHFNEAIQSAQKKVQP
jgi:hypothetical protein